MELVFILPTTLPTPVLIALAIGCILPLIVALVLLAFVPDRADRVVLIIEALRCLVTCEKSGFPDNKPSVGWEISGHHLD